MEKITLTYSTNYTFDIKDLERQLDKWVEEGIFNIKKPTTEEEWKNFLFDLDDMVLDDLCEEKYLEAE